MRAPFSELLREAARRGSAVGAFTCYNLETAAGVLRAAASRRRGVILLISRGSFVQPDGELLVAALRAAAAAAPVPAAIQLDHVAELELVERAFALGVDAVMADGSALSYDHNVAFVREAAELARASGAAVEAELGGIAGGEDASAVVAAGALTDPAEARLFLEATGAACLAVSIGNVHGTYRRPPLLDWDRLQAIRSRVDCPLSLHGASGIPDADLGQAIGLGIRKVNVNTELRGAYLEATVAQIEAALEGANVLDLNAAQADAIAAIAGAKLDAYGPVAVAGFSPRHSK